MDPSSSVDDAVLESILRLSLEEAAHRKEHVLGKSRVGGSLTTEQYALELQSAELEAAMQSFRDARLARNLADAADDDSAQQQLLQAQQAESCENHAATGSGGSTPSFDMDHDHLVTVDSPGRLTPELFPEQDK